MKPKSKSRPSLLRRFLGWLTMDRLRSVWGFLSEHVLDPMARFFAHCFRFDDNQERRTSPVQDWGYFPSDYRATPFLRFRDEYGIMEDLESGGVVDSDRSDPAANDAVNLEDQAKFLKACGVSRSPAGRSNQSSTPSDLGGSDRRSTEGRSIRFELNENPDSDRSGSNYSGKSQFKSLEEGNKNQLSGQGHSPYPTPLILSKEMQTPGTVFASAKKQGGAVAGKVRSQFVYPVEYFTHRNELKADHIGADP